MMNSDTEQPEQPVPFQEALLTGWVRGKLCLDVPARKLFRSERQYLAWLADQAADQGLDEPKEEEPPALA